MASGRISVFSSKELQGVILLMKGLDRELAKQVRKARKAFIEPMWKRSLAEHASTPLEHVVLVATARVAVSDQNVTLRSATVGRSLQGGAKPADIAAAAEFGANRGKTTTYTATSRRGTRYQVTRRTRAQFRPRKRTGYVVYQAAADDIPRIAASDAQTAIRTTMDLLEGATRG